MDRKEKGRKREHKTMDYLESQGYRCTRSGGSLGAWDVIAISANMVRLIQVKSNRWPGSKEMQELEEFPIPAGVSKEIWRWNDYAREPNVRYIL